MVQRLKAVNLQLKSLLSLINYSSDYVLSLTSTLLVSSIDSEAVVKGINGNSEGSSMGLKLIQEICRLQNLGGSIRNVCT
ncbi:hypothetical protein GYH30_051501 [Glycine max]|uniref:Uncharacterized protein n=2 Tax=Glycine subgen. Soja TaxID=1462606 RepID=A0A0R0FHB6_SOYBN|nr:hypothetical protein JHK87_051688 [Glycine soja]KAH1156726.1 hypothetical protein GYH30_051501 [Glycine max]RZB54288.1 hypothetical protein D0Y65_049951 [Glycine soja]